MKPFNVLSALLLMAYTVTGQVPIKKLQESSEYKELKKKFDKDLEDLRTNANDTKGQDYFLPFFS